MKILVINPNLTQAITEAVTQVARSSASSGTEIVAVTGTFGPEVIASRAENALAAHGVLELAARHVKDCNAVILGVSLDSGLYALRELLDVPVVGMTEAALHAASLLATRVAVLTFGARLVPLYEDLAREHGVAARVVRVAALPFAPTEAFTDRQRVRDALRERCCGLVQADGAEAIVLAGAAFAGMRKAVQADVPVPLIDGIETAVPLAEALVRLAYPKARTGSLSHPGARAAAGLSPELTALLSRRG
jgi:allantoin racemase